MLTDEKILSIIADFGLTDGPVSEYSAIAFARAIAAEQREIDAGICERLTHSAGTNLYHAAHAIRNQGEKK